MRFNFEDFIDDCQDSTTPKIDKKHVFKALTAHDNKTHYYFRVLLSFDSGEAKWYHIPVTSARYIKNDLIFKSITFYLKQSIYYHAFQFFDKDNNCLEANIVNKFAATRPELDDSYCFMYEINVTTV